MSLRLFVGGCGHRDSSGDGTTRRAGVRRPDRSAALLADRRALHEVIRHRGGRVAAGWESRLRREVVSNVQAARALTEEEELPWPYDTAAPPGNVVVRSVETDDPRALVMQGVRRVRETIARAFGPLGGSFAGSTAGTMPLRRGLAIAEVIRGTNPLEQRGIEEMQAPVSRCRPSGTERRWPCSWRQR